MIAAEKRTAIPKFRAGAHPAIMNNNICDDAIRGKNDIQSRTTAMRWQFRYILSMKEATHTQIMVQLLLI